MTKMHKIIQTVIELLKEADYEPPPDIPPLSNYRTSGMVPVPQKDFSLRTKQKGQAGINCFYRKFAGTFGFAEFCS